jgi:hypothetical protein
MPFVRESTRIMKSARRIEFTPQKRYRDLRKKKPPFDLEVSVI